MEATIHDRRRCEFPHNRKEGCREHQSIDEGTLIDFEKGKLTGFRVVVQGEPTMLPTKPLWRLSEGAVARGGWHGLH